MYSFLPEISFEEIDGYINSTRNLPTSERYAIILFSSGCKGCQNAADIILNNISSFDETTLIFLSPESLNRIEHFMINQSLNGKDNIYFGHISLDSIESRFGKSNVPWSFIYDENRELINSGLAITTIDIEKYFK